MIVVTHTKPALLLNIKLTALSYLCHGYDMTW